MTQDQPSRLDRIEATLATHNEILSQLAPLTAQVTQLLTRTAEKTDRHDQALTRLEQITTYNTEALTRLEQITTRNTEALTHIEGAIANLITQMNQLGSRVDALTTTTTETLRLVADNSRQIAQNSQRVEQILEYLFRERPNGRGNGND